MTASPPETKRRHLSEVDPPEPAAYKPNFELQEQPVEIAKLTINPVKRNEDDEPVVPVVIPFRATYDLDPASPQGFLNLPVTAKVARALVEECSRIPEGTNTTKIDIKRDFPSGLFYLHTGEEPVEFSATIKGTPKATVKVGAITVDFKVEALIPLSKLTALVSATACAELLLTVSDAQGQLPLD